nr:hypothetical protein [Campylobacter sp.]
MEKLKKQLYKCKHCHKQFTLKADISEVAYNDYIANLNLKYLSKFNNLSSRTIK